RVFMPAGVEKAVGAADSHAHAIVLILERIVLGIAIASDREHLEAHDHLAAIATPMVGGGKITIDAAANLLAFRLHRDGLGDGEIAVALDPHVADEIENTLDRAGRHDHRQYRKERDRDARRHGLPPSETCGAAACDRSSSSKNGCSRKPNGRASSTPGNDSMPMLRLRTAPL